MNVISWWIYNHKDNILAFKRIMPRVYLSQTISSDPSRESFSRDTVRVDPNHQPRLC